MATRVRSFSKLNLGLAVGPPRQDGFHGLTTVYQTLALHDYVTVSAERANETSITLTADRPGVPSTERGDAEKNTAWRIVAGALEKLGLAATVSIGIEKRLPVQGGMGAGSANAAAALLGLERELGIELPEVERLALAAEVGSDVPLFLLGGTVLGLGRGEIVSQLGDLPVKPVVIAIPEVGVSTALAFQELDRRMEKGVPQGLKPTSVATSYGTAEAVPLTKPNVTSSDTDVLTFQQGTDRLEMLSRALAAIWTPSTAEHDSSGIARRSGDLAENQLLALVRTGIENDFEEVVFSQHPSLRQIKRELVGSETSGRPLCAGLSGSGSALFGLYESQADARAAQQRVQQSGTRAILTETLPRDLYWSSMFL
jgi:4-diphosphocytidyl-2-C-methyl-D-erythritol kinase